MTNQDIAAIVTAAVSTTVAVMLVAFHLYLRSYRRTLATVRYQRGRWYDEARALRADRPAVHRSMAEHARTAVAVTEPIPYRLADPTAYLPVFAGDTPGGAECVAEYVQLRDAARKVWSVSR